MRIFETNKETSKQANESNDGQDLRRLQLEEQILPRSGNPPAGGGTWTYAQYAEGLHHPLAERQFQADIDALTWADTCVLVLPCGRSAHTEAGWMAGAGKRVLAYIPEMLEPELMYKLFDAVAGSLDELVEKLQQDKN